MKKAGMMLVAGLLVTGALAQDVTSVNVVGFNKIAIGPGKLALVTLPFESFGDSTIEDLVGSQLTQGSAFIWDRLTKSYIFTSRGKAGWAGTNVIYRGDGFWLRNTGTETNYVSFMGEVPADYNNSSTTTIHNLSGLDLIGYAYPTDVIWTNTTLANNPAVTALYVWDYENQQYAFYSKAKAGWSTPEGFTLTAGRGFWLKSSSPIDWTEVAPYNL